MHGVIALHECSDAQRLAVERLYTSSFPASERDVFGVILNHEQEGWLSALIRVDDSGEVEALCFAYRLSLSPPAVYIAYYAVDPERRGGGIGTTMLKESLAKLVQPGDAGTLFEIERAASEPWDSYRPVRQRFWERQGAYAILDRFLAPRLDAPGTIDLTLMWIPNGDATAPTGLDAARALYLEGYELAPDEAKRLLAECS